MPASPYPSRRGSASLARVDRITSKPKARDSAGDAHAEATDAPVIPTPTWEAPQASAEAIRAQQKVTIAARERKRSRATVASSAAPPPTTPSARASSGLAGAAGRPISAIHEGARV